MILVMIAVSVLLFSVFYFIGSYRKENSERKLLETIISQVVSVLESNEDKLEDAKKLFQDDYLNRARNLAYIIAETTDNSPSNEELQQLAKRMQVADIHMIDENGVIQTSSEEEALGLDFYKEEQLAPFIPLIESQNENDYYIEMNGYDLGNHKDMIYVGVKPFGENKGVVQIAIEPKMLAAYEQKSSIASTIESMPVRDSITIFVVNEETGKLLGISKQKSKELTIGKDGETEDIVTSLKKYVNTPGRIWINGKEKTIEVKEYDGSLVAVTSELDGIYSSLPKAISIVGVVVILLITIFSYCLYKLIDFFVIQDIQNMVRQVEQFANGDANVKFLVKRNTELSTMSDALNNLVNIVENRPQRISKVLSMIGDTFAICEYFHDLNQFFCSDNLPNLLEKDREECEQSIRMKFLELVNSPDFHKEKEMVRETSMITKNGRYLQIQTLVTDNTICTLVRDISKEKAQHQKLSNELSIANERAARDALTGLYNRHRVREFIDEWFISNQIDGILILMDLDNFKKVNDEKGHPAGDALLRQFADILFKQFRSSDMKARIGGDEFVVFIPNFLELDVLKGKLETFLVACRKGLSTYYEEHRLSVSIGAAYSNQNIHSYDELYQYADSAMYVTKRNGKDGFYINEDNVICMRSECINCRKQCRRREALYGGDNVYPS